jgi:hypothetical protein
VVVGTTADREAVSKQASPGDMLGLVSFHQLLATTMPRYPYTTAGSILMLGAAVLFTGAAYKKSELETCALAAVSLLFVISGLALIFRREEGRY